MLFKWLPFFLVLIQHTNQGQKDNARKYRPVSPTLAPGKIMEQTLWFGLLWESSAFTNLSKAFLLLFPSELSSAGGMLQPGWVKHQQGSGCLDDQARRVGDKGSSAWRPVTSGLTLDLPCLTWLLVIWERCQSALLSGLQTKNWGGPVN